MTDTCHEQRLRPPGEAPAVCLRLLADDLTGALDSAVPFATPAAPVGVVWRQCVPDGAIAIDVGTRELDAVAAYRRLVRQVAALPSGPGACHFLKLDSLLRGHAVVEIRAWREARPFDHAILAPAFPRQGRVTRGGRQYWRDDETWVPTACDLAAELRAAGFALSLCRPGETAPVGVTLWDADTDADLQAIVAAGRTLEGEVLWCGSGGLASALAGAMLGAPVQSPPLVLPRPVLGLFGTDHPVTAAQLAACGPFVLKLEEGDAISSAEVAGRLAMQGVALVQLALPDGLDRAAAADRIAGTYASLLSRLAAPATLLVSGGETLRAVCLAVGADRLELEGELAPGIPHSILRGGRMDGVSVVSKSGAFGAVDTLKRLLSETPLSARGSSS